MSGTAGKLNTLWIRQRHRLRDIDPVFLLIIVTATALRFTRIGQFDNPYYTATVASMLQDPNNFLFASFDPFGLVSVDKPPLSFWIQGAFAAVLGLKVYVVTLPQVIGGILCVTILYQVIRPTFGQPAARCSAAVLAILPVSVVIDSRNEPDALVTVFTLLAAAMLIKSVRSERSRWLFLCFFLLGMAFNTKMLVALIPLPAFILYYLAATRLPMKTSLIHLFQGLLILLAVSASWITMVALTPSSQRPYVGSTPDDSIWTLVFDYNGVRRFTGFRNSIQPRPADQSQLPHIPLIGREPQQNPSLGNPPIPPLRPHQLGDVELSTINPINLTRAPLGAQLGWLLPMGATGLLFITTIMLTSNVHQNPRNFIQQLKGSPRSLDGLLWATWLVTGIVTFGLSGATATHPYYLVGLAVPLAAMLGLGASSLFGESQPGRRWFTGAAVVLLATLIFQIVSVADSVNPLFPVLIGLVAATSTLILTTGIYHNLQERPLSRWAMMTLITLLLCLPAVEAINSGAKIVYGIGSPMTGNSALLSRTSDLTLRFRDLSKLGIDVDDGIGIATFNAREAAPLIIAGYKAVAIGGFSGRDPILNVDSFQDFAERQNIGYVFVGRSRDHFRRNTIGQTEILRYIEISWLDQSSALGLPKGSFYAKPS